MNLTREINLTRTLIIAEAGVNHNGDLNIAKQLIDVAVEAEVDLVKFQTFKADSLVSRMAKKADYQLKKHDESDSQYEMLKNLELTEKDHYELLRYCNSKNIKFFSTAFDVDGLDFLNQIGLPFFKVPSGEITNYPYLKKLAEIGKPVILSTGMSIISEIQEAIEVLTSKTLTKNELVVLHCNTEYPTPMTDVNLKAMININKELGVNVGYSDHTLGIEIPIAAVALGAKVIEKHFTLDRLMTGPDHAASLEPKELKEMVRAIRNIELATSGDGIKTISESEQKNREIARKSIHTKIPVKKGETLSNHHLISLRPGIGITPMRWNEFIGKTVTVDLPAFHILREEDIK